MSSTEYRPKWASHVKGTYSERQYDEGGIPEPQLVQCWCEWPECGAYWQIHCETGATRAHIARFASVHIHKDVFAPRPPLEPSEG